MSRLVRGLKFVHFLLLMKPALAIPCSLLHRMPCKKVRKTGVPHKACHAADTKARGGRPSCWETALRAISLHYPFTRNRQGTTLHHFSCRVTAVCSPPPPLRCIKSFRDKGEGGGRVTAGRWSASPYWPCTNVKPVAGFRMNPTLLYTDDWSGCLSCTACSGQLWRGC